VGNLGPRGHFLCQGDPSLPALSQVRGQSLVNSAAGKAQVKLG